MKMLGTLVSVQNGDEFDVLIVSPLDNLWFVQKKAFTPEMSEAVSDIEATGTMTVLGAVFGAE